MKTELAIKLIKKLVEDTKSNSIIWSSQITETGNIKYKCSFPCFDIILFTLGLSQIPSVYMKTGNNSICLFSMDNMSDSEIDLKTVTSCLLVLAKAQIAKQENWESTIVNYLKQNYRETQTNL